MRANALAKRRHVARAAGPTMRRRRRAFDALEPAHRVAILRYCGTARASLACAVLHGARILVADDDLDLLEAVSEFFERCGANVVRGKSGAELIERMADAGPFALVVTDVCMPWMDGLQAMHAMRTAGLGAPIIIMTALRDKRLAARMRALGQRAILLSKPFELAELEAAATSLLSRQGGGA